MKRAQHITEIISYHKKNNIPYDINKLTDLSLADLKSYIYNTTTPKQEPPKQEPPKQEPPKQEPPKQEPIQEEPIQEEQEDEQEEQQEEQQEQEEQQQQEEEEEEEEEEPKPVINKRVSIKTKPVNINKRVETIPPKYYDTEEDEEFDHIMYIIDSYENDIKQLLSLYDLKNLRQEDKDVIYDTYTTYRDELDEDISPYTLDKQLKITLRSVINRNRNIIQRYI